MGRAHRHLMSHMQLSSIAIGPDAVRMPVGSGPYLRLSAVSVCPRFAVVTDIAALADRLDIGDLITKLFVYCDQARWGDLAESVLAEQVYFDNGFGGPVGTRPGIDITNDWAEGLGALDAVHHQAGNHLIEITGGTAQAHADAIAVHLKNDATQGKTRWFVGSYALGFQRTEKGWRIDRFEYQLKLIDGNADLT